MRPLTRPGASYRLENSLDTRKIPFDLHLYLSPYIGGRRHFRLTRSLRPPDTGFPATGHAGFLYGKYLSDQDTW